MRRKITMLFVALLACMGVVKAQTVITDLSLLTDDMECTVSTNGRGGWAVNEAGDNFGSTNDHGFGTTVDANNAQHLFQFKKIEDKYYLYSVHAKKFAKSNRSLSESAEEAIELMPQGDNTFVVRFDASHYINLGGSNQMTIDTWSTPDAGNKVTITSKTSLGLDVEFAALIASAEAKLATVNDNIGTIIGKYSQETANNLSAAITTAKAVASATEDDMEALQAALDAVSCILPTAGNYYQFHSAYQDFTATRALYSNGSNARWMTLDNNDKRFYWLAEETAEGIVLKNANDDKYLHGNVNTSGNWSVVETSAGAEMSVKIMAETEDAVEYAIILNGRHMHAANSNSGKATESNIVSWETDAANTCSSWYIVEAELPSFCDIVYNFDFEGETKYTQTTTLAVGAAYPAISVAFPYGVTATRPEGVVSKSETIVIPLNVEHELPFVAAADVNSIDTWYYAQMHANPNVTAYVEDNENDANNVEWQDKFVADDEIDSHLWGFVGDVWSGVKMVNKGTGRAIVSTSGAAVMGDAADATAFIPVYSNDSYNEWFCLKYPESSNYLNAQEGQIKSWSDNDNGSSFFVTEYDKEYAVNVSNLGYATYYSQYKLAIPGTVNAYVVAEANDGSAVLEQVTGILPARTGVILEGKGSYTFKTSAAKPATIASNLLKGSAVAEEVTVAENKIAYILGNGSEGVGLYKVKLDGRKFTNGANKAYMVLDMPAEGDAAPAMFSFGRGEGTTGIDNSQFTIDNVVIYDLTGRRVETMEKGIYIVNGKKVIR